MSFFTKTDKPLDIRIEGDDTTKTQAYAYVGTLNQGSSAHYPYDVVVTMEDGAVLKYATAASPGDVKRTANAQAKRYVKNLGLPYRVTGEGTV